MTLAEDRHREKICALEYIKGKERAQKGYYT